MPEDPPTPPPETPEPRHPGQNVGAAFAGETTRSISEPSPTPPRADSTTLSEDGTVLRPSNPQRETVGDFEIISKLGQGGMGAVYRARQVSLDRQVALKILPATLEADADFVSRFQREARVAASLSHGNLVKVFSSGQADGCHFIAMELIEGETLGQWLKRSGALPPQEALRICADVARALEHGWNRAQLIHRDIKPGNIFLSIHGDVKVGDLGLAKTLGGDTTGLTHTGTAMGTPHYISPEQARGDKDLDFRADIYSLGCTLYQMLTGRTPYEGRDPVSVMHQHIHGPPPAILKVLPSCPIPLARLVGKMLKKVKRERHTSYAELLAQIDGVQALFAPTESALESTLPPDPDATLLATPGQTPRSGSATPATAPLAPPTTRPAPTGPKSKAGLYGAIAMGVAVLGAVAFFAWPKEEKLTKAQLYAQQREAEAATRAAAATPVPTSPAPLNAGAPQWRKILITDDQLGDKARRGTDGEIVLDGFWKLPGLKARDVAIRAEVRPEPGTTSPPVFRLRVASGARTFNILPTQALLQAEDAERKFRGLASQPLSQPVTDAEWQPILFATVGPWSLGSYGGAPAFRGTSDLVIHPGEIHLTGKGRIRNLEVLLLDGLPEAEALRLAGAAPAAPQWRKITLTAEQLAETQATLGPDGEWIIKGALFLPDLTARNLVLRCEIQRNRDADISIQARWTAARARQLNFGKSSTALQFRRDDGSYQTHGTIPHPAPDDGIANWVPVQFGVVGQKSVGSIRGTVAPNGDSTELLDPGQVAVSGRGKVRNVEVLVLDGLPDEEAIRLATAALAAGLPGASVAPGSAAATPAIATKDAPFVNSLGMKFVPVPITGGPSDGQRVLFSVWETRVRDYEAFTKETQREWKKPDDMELEPTHPAVRVTWEDATAFCAWLTERERKAGKLGASERYRLPSDHEWSCAVGIGAQEDAARTPAEKGKELPDLYPWGGVWPPPDGTGNYSSVELRPLVAAGKFPWLAGRITDRRDGHATLAPVGSYAADRFGLHDLGGNTREWCEDWSDAQRDKRVARGSSWSSNDSFDTRSSFRRPLDPENRGDVGFRVVLAPAP